MKKYLLLLFTVILFKPGNAQTPTWATDIAPILYKNCTACHHAGGLAPFALITYNDAHSQRLNISNDVSIGKMPPWMPDPSYRRLAHERILSKSDIKKINDWVIAGAPAGDTTAAPTPPVYTNGSALGTPDLTLTIPTYTVPAGQTNDIYQCFTIPSGLLQDKYITALEIVPGNPSIVHHVLVYQDTTGKCAQLDANSAGPGYTNFGGVGTSKAILVGGWVPGTMPNFMPANMGTRLYKSSDLVIQVHYPAGSNGKSDSTKLNLKLASSVAREVYLQPVLNYFTSIVNGPLKINANTVKTFEEHFTVPAFDVSVLSIAPHCHLLGKNWISYGVTPQGDTIPLIKINNWDFHWQGFYQFRNVLKAPAGTELYAFCTYDNTTSNPSNPSNPPITVTAGEATTNEMMLVYFSYTLYQPGDENIAIDTSALVDITDTTGTTTGIPEPNAVVSTPQLYNAVPDPAKDETMFSYFIPAATPVELKIFDLNGRLVDQVQAPNALGFNNLAYNTNKLSSGTYIYSLFTKDGVKSKQLIIDK